MRKKSTTKCIVEQCSKMQRTRGYCQHHYSRWLKKLPIVWQKPPPKICSVENCKGKQHSNGFCGKHNARYKRYGDPLKICRAEPGKGRFINTQGYVDLFKPEHKNSKRGGYILEHRYVMSLALGRPLNDKEYVHHKNGNKLDNRLENLELWATFQPPGQRPKDLVKYAISLLELYADNNELIEFALSIINKNKINKCG